jgi:hypothetical protein
LTQFKNVLLAVDDPQRPLGRQLPDVTGVEEAVVIKALRGQLRLPVVAAEQLIPFDTYLATLGAAIWHVVELWDALQPQVNARERHTHRPILGGGIWVGDKGAGAGLRQAIPLHKHDQGEVRSCEHVLRKRNKAKTQLQHITASTSSR